MKLVSFGALSCTTDISNMVGKRKRMRNAETLSLADKQYIGHSCAINRYMSKITVLRMSSLANGLPMVYYTFCFDNNNEIAIDETKVKVIYVK